MKRRFLLWAACSLLMFEGFTQNIAINEDGSLPNPHAIVDIKSSTKGVLIPRMNTAARLAIPNTKGLLVYDTDNNLVWYNTGTTWESINTDAASGTAWLLKGNNNTQDKVNFIGTTNNVPLNIKVNNQPAGRIDPKRNNAYWGYQAGKSDSLGSNNIAMGFQALYSNKFGFSNVALGAGAMFLDNGSNNTVAIGDSALFHGGGFQTTAVGSKALFTVAGDRNTAIGYNALFSNDAGYENTAVGSGCMGSNTTGRDNTAIGDICLASNTIGTDNTAGGYFALLYNTRGIANTAFGEDAAAGNTTGSFNVAIGVNAGAMNATGDNNTSIGANSGSNVDGLSGTLAIGAGAFVDASNKVRIGGNNVISIEGQGTFTTPSDGRFKFNIHENVKGLDFILKLRPVTYQFDVKKQEDFTRGKIKPEQIDSYISQVGNDEATQMIRTGFIAQEVEQAAKKVSFDFDGVKAPKTEKAYYSLSYASFVVPLVKAVQEQQEIIGSQNKKMEQQDKRISDLEKQLADIKKLLEVSH